VAQTQQRQQQQDLQQQLLQVLQQHGSLYPDLLTLCEHFRQQE
jgi:hypothetical protein